MTDPMTAKQVALLPSQTAMCQLFFTIESRPKFLKLVADIQAHLGTKTMTETIEKAVWAYAEIIKQAPITPIQEIGAEADAIMEF